MLVSKYLQSSVKYHVSCLHFSTSTSAAYTICPGLGLCFGLPGCGYRPQPGPQSGPGPGHVGCRLPSAFCLLPSSMLLFFVFVFGVLSVLSSICRYVRCCCQMQTRAANINNNNSTSNTNNNDNSDNNKNNKNKHRPHENNKGRDEIHFVTANSLVKLIYPVSGVC